MSSKIQDTLQNSLFEYNCDGRSFFFSCCFAGSSNCIFYFNYINYSINYQPAGFSHKNIFLYGVEFHTTCGQNVSSIFADVSYTDSTEEKRYSQSFSSATHETKDRIRRKHIQRQLEEVVDGFLFISLIYSCVHPCSSIERTIRILIF